MRDRSARFARYLQRWWDAQLEDGAYPGEWLRGRDTAAIAHEFRTDAQFEVSQAAFLHHRPSEDVARRVVDQLTPRPEGPDVDTLVEAIVAAGATAQKVRATTVVGAMVTVTALVVRNLLRGR